MLCQMERDHNDALKREEVKERWKREKMYTKCYKRVGVRVCTQTERQVNL